MLAEEAGASPMDTIVSQSTPENGLLLQIFRIRSVRGVIRGMNVPETFRGYASFANKKPTALKLFEFTPKNFDDHDVDIRVTHCGVRRLDFCSHMSG